MPYRSGQTKPRDVYQYPEKVDIMDEKPGLAALILYAVFSLVVGILAKAYVAVILWGWFVVPAGGPMVAMWNIMGLSMLFSFLTKGYDAAQKKNEQTHSTSIQNCVLSVLIPLLSLGMGWVYHSLM